MSAGRDTSPPGGAPSAAAPGTAPAAPNAREALARLAEGNRRFVAEDAPGRPTLTHARRAELARGQQPFAIVLGCSDSRVPAEIVFDQGFGDLFVIRVAGNIVAPSQLASVEFAATQYGTRLVVVLGHSRCGAILATLQELEAPAGGRRGSMGSIVDRIRPVIEGLPPAAPGDDAGELVHRAVRANVRASADRLRHGSDVLEHLIRDEGLAVVGAEYSLATGIVDFFDGAAR